MSSEITVLLLEAETLPSALEEHLAKREVFVEHASGGDVAQMLPMIGPDLVVQSGTLDPLPTIGALKNETNPPPLVIIAERGRLRELRENQDPLIHGLIRADLPVAAIAHRLSTMARRSAEGLPLEGAKPADKAAPPKVERGSLAPLPLAPLQQVKIVDPEQTQRQEEQEAQQRKEAQVAREEAALRETEAAKAAVEAARQKAKAAAEEKAKAAAEEKAKAAAEEKAKAAAEEKAKAATEQRRREMELRAEQRKAELEERRREQTARLEERKREQEKKRDERLREQERRSKERASVRVSAQKTSERPKPPENTPSEVKALDDLFSAATPEPATIRSSHPPELARLVERTATEDLEQTTQAVDISAFAPELDKRAKSQVDPSPERPSAPPQRPAVPVRGPSNLPERPTGSRAEEPAAGRVGAADFSAVKKTEDLSVIMPLPVDLRLDLAPKAALKPIRLALLDTDLLRADAVAAELRERGMKIHPVTPDPGRTRWPLLRRFAPQGLLVDEKSMPRGAAEWVETFRGDPFLRHVPVVLVRFSRVFDEATGKVILDPVLPMIEHLGREEFALLEKLGPGRRVDLWLSQVTPYRLVEMLTKEDRNTRLDCKSDTERMVWHLGPGYAGRGKLADLKTDAPKQRLSPAEALAWLLGHEDCQISVFEHAEPLAHASESVDAEELIREMTETLAAPERHESVRPGSLSQAQRPPSAPDLSPSEAALHLPNHAIPPPPSGFTALGSKALPKEDASRERPTPRSKTGLTARLDSAADALKQAYATYEHAARSRLSPLEAKVPQPVLRHAPWALPLLLAAVLLLLVLARGEDPEQPKAASAVPANHDAKKAAAPTDSTRANPASDDSLEDDGDEFDSGSGNLWLVEGGNTFPTCEERLGASAPKGKDPTRSSGYWKNARRLLMLGNSEEAIENLCLAGLLDPAGPASEGLAEYYLGQRALAQAERWIQESLKADPERRKSKELLGDIENQKGNTEQAKKLLLETLNLSSDETRKLEATARKFQKDARLARKGGDLPRAERELRRAALLSPADAEIAIELGDTLLRREASVAASRWAAQALKLDPNNSSAMLLAARVAETLGKKEKAREYYEMVPLGDPNHDEAQRRRGRL